MRDGTSHPWVYIYLGLLIFYHFLYPPDRQFWDFELPIFCAYALIVPTPHPLFYNLFTQ